MDILASFLVKGGFSPDKFFWSKKCFCFSNFVSTQPRPLGFLALFWHQKWDNYCDEDCSHFGRYLFGCLFVQSSLIIFFVRMTQYYRQNLFCIIIFYCTINRKYWACTFFQKLPWFQKSIQQKWPAPCSCSEKWSNYQFMSCYLISIYERTSDDCLLLVN